MTDEPIVDAHVVEDAPPDEGPVRADLVVVGKRREVLMPADANQVVAAMTAYQELLPRLLDTNDWQTTRDGQFVKKSGWRKIARAFNLSVELVSQNVERDEHGNPIRATAIARAIAPNGQTQDGDGYCSVDEPRFKKESARQKIENDLRATATTRAKNRAISDLVGMGEVSAEEVDAGGSDGLVEASPELKQQVRAALSALVDGDVRATSGLVDAVGKHFDGRLPAAAGQAILIVATHVKRHRQAIVGEQQELEAS